LADGSGLPVQFLALQTDPIAIVLVAGAELGRHQGYAAARADRRTVVIHGVSIPGSRAYTS